MTSLSDMVSTAIAGLLSAALSHFGATDGNDHPKKQVPPPAAHAQPATRAPVPDDDRFAPANPDAHTIKPRRNLPGHSA